MKKLKERLWNWGHLEGSHNACTKLNCKMTPEEFAEEYGIENAFIVSYGGNIQPPYSELAKRLSPLKQIKWSVLGDASTPLPDCELGWTDDVCAVAKEVKNVNGGVVDDFFSPKRVERFTVPVLKKMKDRLNACDLDFWCVLYELELERDIDAHLQCFDGATFWVWESEHIKDLDEILDKAFRKLNGKPVMLGVYLWDYAGSKSMNEELFTRQLDKYFSLLCDGKIAGIVFCSSTVGDAELKTNAILKDYIRKFGDVTVE